MSDNPSTAPAERFPLHWPDDWPRTEPADRTQASFKVTSAAALQSLDDELRRLGATDSVLSTNIPVTQAGRFYARYADSRLEDPGVAVWFQLDGEWRVIACDRWTTLRANVRSIALTINALRGLERWGTSQLLERVFRGFTALPGSGDPFRPWWSAFSFVGIPTLEEAERAYRELARINHPDRGGDPARMAELNAAIATARRELA